jgi:hypothetical protein
MWCLTGNEKSISVGKKIVRKRRFVEVVCTCGNIKWIDKYFYTSGRSKKCRLCYYKLRIPGNKTHGMSTLPASEYTTWVSMKGRCLNPKNAAFKYYGGRGISVSKSWMEFENFYKDMGPRPSKRHTLERLNYNKGYSKNNCCWATQQEQAKKSKKKFSKN